MLSACYVALQRVLQLVCLLGRSTEFKELERALTVFIDHYNTYRPHRGLDLAPPNGRPVIAIWTGAHTMAVKRRDRLGGLLHEYERAA